MSKLGAAIERAVRAAKSRGINIARRATFDWYGDEKLPRSCNATGAVLLEMGLGRGLPQDWPVLMREHLGCSKHDLYKLYCGWNVGNVIQVERDGDGRYRDDALSLEMNRLARRLTGS